MDRTYAEVLKDACATLTGFPQLRELDNEISALERSLGCASTSRGPAGYRPIDTRVPELAIRTSEGYTEELAFTLPSDVPARLIPSTRNAAHQS